MDNFEDYDKYANIFWLNNRPFFNQKDLPDKIICLTYKKDGKYWVVMNSQYMHCCKTVIDIVMYLIALRFYESNRMDEYTVQM